MQVKITGWVLLLSILITMVPSPVQAEVKKFEAVMGEMDLRGAPFEEHIFRLEGEWEFYHNELLTTETWRGEAGEAGTVQKTFIQAPSIWSKAAYTGQDKLSNLGYGTYRLKVKIDERYANQVLSMYIPPIASAYRLWVNGEELAANGIVGSDRASMSPKSYSKVVPFKPGVDEIEMVVQVSNFVQRKGGMWAPLILGKDVLVQRHQEIKVVRDIFLASIILVLGFYHFSLYLGALCLLLCIRVLLVGEMLLIRIFPSINWELSVKMEYLSIYIGIMALFKFISFLYPHESNRHVVRACLFISLFFCATTLFPAIVSTYFMLPFFVALVLMIAYMGYISLSALYHKREGALLNCISLSIMLLLSFNDYLFYSFSANTTELAPFGILLFIFIQTLILGKRSSNAFSRAEQLTLDLHKANQSLEQKVVERTLELQVSNEQLLHIEQTRKTFFSNIAHELGTPIQSVQGYIQLLQANTNPGAKQEYLALAYEKTSMLSRLIKDLLDLAKMEEGQLKFLLEKVDADALLTHLYDRSRWDIEREQMQPRFSPLTGVPDGYSAFVNIDIIRIEQVVSNLVNNSIRFTSSGGIIHLQGQFVNRLTQGDAAGKAGMERDYSPAVEGTDGWVQIVVTDTGLGIDKQLLPHVFERFRKGEPADNRAKGSGLGLVICKHIMLRHQGEIWVESTPGLGTRVTMALPATLQHKELEIEIDEI
ncbi:sensor histidine kinase [Paenibacillus eucommiae]|uniref:histidine kinase n=1 Tax=Paenibacillus eucommiae TaxID=1355755 RepID=A0ABS4J145_9BACL|nr:sensor histidine kinase [Paenibacillus eucommiae]MBP1993563.1 signal transduction histidine kinase [Paenibacillus eucommiae]